MNESASAPHTRPVSRRSVLQFGAAAGVAAAFTAVAPPGTALAAGGSLSLARDGRSRYAVLVGRQESSMVRRAGRELAELMRQVTGAAFPLVDESTPHDAYPDLVVVGTRNPHARRFGTVDPARLGDDGFAVRTDRHDILLTGPGELGTLHSAYWFLETQLGVQWYDDTAATVPARPTIELRAADLDRDHVPRFRFRQLHYGEAFGGEHRHHLKLNGRRDMYGIQVPADLDTWSGYWPEDRPTFFHDLVTDPSLVHDYNLLFMNEDARAQATVTVVRLINERIERGEDASLGIIQADRNPWQPDPASRAFIEAHGGAGGAAMFDFVNDVARRVRQVIPSARLETEAYQWSIKPPAGMTIEDNVVITVCPIFAQRGKPIMDPANQEQADHLTGWAQICENIVLWDYQTMFSNYLMPFPQWYDGFESIRQVAALPQVRGLFIQGVWNTRGGDMSALRTWVLSRLAWDPTLDVDKTVQAFLRGYYGPAARHIDAYMRTLWASKEANGPLSEASGPMSPIYPLDVARTADGHLARAESAVRNDPLLRDRVTVARFNLDYLICMRAPQYLADLDRLGQTWDLDLDNRVARARRAITISGIDHANEGGGDPARIVDEFGLVADSFKPAGTTNLAFGAEVSYSSSYESPNDTWASAYVHDGRYGTSTGWSTPPFEQMTDPGADAWLAFDLSAESTVNRVVVFPRQEAFPKNYRLETSADATTWTSVATSTGNPGDRSEPQVFDLAPAATGRYVRLYVEDRSDVPVGPYGYLVQLSELAIFGTQGG